ncbi:MAG: SDR family NAD(P)-dependent oxidoreductase [Alphaproteobacteria bacterium]|jgi:NADP-dependent 3-hydroxy acid dehydrogenase YdfG|nr:SDR family NAD(P)-dependent oxidoreductase [Alphaproteobacteria bacterium]MDP6565962.1 SDR family NAD(P)-dependent oxidoreductase [Alphaproteobacteria bacterium]MDP6814315.1 SDR family NAD(P)-dependent oxidoreductase [Alphaproteobacteria bacterium]
MTDKVALVAGVGRGTGAAVAKRFAAAGYRVALVARKESRLKEYEAELEGSLALPCDITDPAALEEMLARCRVELGEPDVVVHNAARGSFGNFLEIDPADVEENFRVNTMSLLYLARAVAPAMIERGDGAIMVTGNTSARRGIPSFSGFAPTKAAQRILAESIARELGPKGIHVAYIIIDAMIDLWWTRRRNPDHPEERFAQPDDIAETVYQVSQQPRTAWSFNVEVRPYAEVW